MQAVLTHLLLLLSELVSAFRVRALASDCGVEEPGLGADVVPLEVNADVVFASGELSALK